MRDHSSRKRGDAPLAGMLRQTKAWEKSPDTMRVLQLTNNYPTNDFPVFGIFVKEQIESLNALGIENSVFFINGREKGKREYCVSIGRLRRLLRLNCFDIVHCHHCFSALALILSGAKGRSKSIVSYQNDPDYEGGRYLFRLISLMSDKVIFKNKSRFLSRPNTLCVPNGVDIGFFKPIDRYEARQHLKLDQQKQYILFMDSYKRRRQKRLDRFEQVVSHLVNDLRISDIEPVVLTNTPRSLIPHYINACNVHVLTSDFEGSPNSVKECLSCDVAVVSTDVGDVRELVQDVPGCYVSKSFEATELAGLVVKALGRDRVNGRDRIFALQLDTASVALRLRSVYEQLLQ